MTKVLFIDDDPGVQKTLRMVLPEAYTLSSAYTAAQGIEAAVRDGPDVVLLDIDLPDMDGIAALRRITAAPGAPPVLMLTALTEPRIVKEAILAGARDYIVKPYDLKELLGTLRMAVAARDTARAAIDDDGPLGRLVGDSPRMREAKELLLRYAPSDAPVLLLGESGTGKELAARLIHDSSRRAAGPFVALNCGALPESLVESELFGAEKGAFTDAVARPGAFERASGGTLFLDEIGEMTTGAQARLLRVLEEKELTRVGGARSIAIDVRVVSATNRDLKAEVAAGGFRQDLFYRLGVLPLRMPPLRERPGDVPLIAAHLLSRTGLILADDARERLLRHPWPGNVRELRNVLERAVLASGGGRIEERHLSFD
jgi:DNA-binding NtrC family response regulator